MTEEFLVLGRPPRPPRRGRWDGRGRKVVAAAVLAVLAGLVGWAVWRATVGDSSSTPPAPAPTPAAPTETVGFVAAEPPLVPYLRSGVLIRPDDLPRGIPDGSWTDFVELSDGRVVLVQEESVTVLQADQAPRRFQIVGGITARADGNAVAWTGADGRVWRLDAVRPDPEVVHRGRVLTPTCRGLRVDGRRLTGWQTCDRDGGLLSPGGRYFAAIGAGTVTIAPRADITGGLTVEVPGTVLDAVWEDDLHLLVVLDVNGEAHLQRMGLGGERQDLIASVLGGDNRRRPVLVLPFTSRSGS